MWISMLCSFIIAGGGAPETELAYQLTQYAQTLPGVDAYCLRYDIQFYVKGTRIIQ